MTERMKERDLKGKTRMKRIKITRALRQEFSHNSKRRKEQRVYRK